VSCQDDSRAPQAKDPAVRSERLRGREHVARALGIKADVRVELLDFPDLKAFTAKARAKAASRA